MMRAYSRAGQRIACLHVSVDLTTLLCSALQHSLCPLLLCSTFPFFAPPHHAPLAVLCPVLCCSTPFSPVWHHFVSLRFALPRFALG